MTEAIIASVVFIVSFGVAVPLAWVALTRPSEVVRQVFRLSSAGRSSGNALDIVASVPPWSWIYQGRDWRAAAAPEEFPRLIVAVRLLGIGTLLIAGAIVSTVIVMFAIESAWINEPHGRTR
jgi:hypothetical protein